MEQSLASSTYSLISIPVCSKKVARCTTRLPSALPHSLPHAPSLSSFSSSSSSSSFRLCPCNLSSAGPSDLPPAGREETLLQARASIAAALERPLRNAGPLTVKQRKQQRQPRLRVEIPLPDDSIATVASLLTGLLSDFIIGKRTVSFVAFCHPSLVEEFIRNPDPSANLRLHAITDSFDSCKSSSEGADVVAMVAPKLPDVTRIATSVSPKPVLLINPDWLIEEEAGDDFVQSFDVVYSYLPLRIQGFFSKTEGAVLKHVRSGAPAGRPWLVFAKEEGGMKCVSSLKKRPDAADLENALYSAAAANSPLTKSVKFLQGLVRRG